MGKRWIGAILALLLASSTVTSQNRSSERVNLSVTIHISTTSILSAICLELQEFSGLRCHYKLVNVKELATEESKKSMRLGAAVKTASKTNAAMG